MKGSPDAACTVGFAFPWLGCAVGSVRCREVCPVGVLAEGIRGGKQKTLGGKQGVALGTWGWGFLAGSHGSNLLFLLVAGSWTGERAMALFDLSHL